MKTGKPTTKLVRQRRDGQITIPKEFREALSLKPDDVLGVTLFEGRLEIVPVRMTPKDTSWVKRLDDLFDPVRRSLEQYSEAEIDQAIDEAVAASRRDRLERR